MEGAEGIEKAEPAAKTLWNAVNGTVVNANNYTMFLSKDTKYTLKFDDAHAVSSYRFKFDNIESPATAGWTKLWGRLPLHFSSNTFRQSSTCTYLTRTERNYARSN